MRAVMQANDLWKLYASGDSTIEAVKGVNVKVNQGEMIAIMGPSGCGKTTLLNILSGIDEPTSGQVMVDEKSLFSVSDNERSRIRAQYLGFIFQDFNLLPVLSAVENVELPLLLLGKSASEARTTALEALKSVGLGERSEHRPSELSGGQQQRVAIARAIVHSPTVILCDEPTGNLDSATSKSVMKLLKTINEKIGTTFLLVTHDGEVAKQCSRVLRMEDGIIVSDERGQEEE